jgi:hypothetical protein
MPSEENELIEKGKTALRRQVTAGYEACIQLAVGG